MIDWLMHLYSPITRKRRCAMFWTNTHPLRSWPFSKLSCWRFDFFPRKFAACSKPPSRDNYRKASYPRTQQRDQGAGWTHNSAIRVVVKTTPLPIWPRCRHMFQLMQFRIFWSKYWIFFWQNSVIKMKVCKLYIVQLSRSTALGRFLLIRMFQWQTLQDVGVETLSHALVGDVEVLSPAERNQIKSFIRLAVLRWSK